MTYHLDTFTKVKAIDTRVSPPRVFLGGIQTLESPKPWFMPRPLIAHAYSVYQVATVINVEVPEYPSGGSDTERNAWREIYEAQNAKADALAQAQAPGCWFLEGSVFGRTYVYDDLGDLKDNGVHTVAALLSTPPQIVSEETFQDMLVTLPPDNWGRTGGVERFSMSEFQDGPVTSAFFRMPDPVPLCMHLFVVPDRGLISNVLPIIETMQIYVGAVGEMLKRGDEIRARVRSAPGLDSANEYARLAHPGLWAFERGGSFDVAPIHAFILNNKVAL